MSGLPWIDADWWEAASEVQRWRTLRRSTIRNMLGLARTSYLNRWPDQAKRRCQIILTEIRASRPALGGR